MRWLTPTADAPRSFSVILKSALTTWTPALSRWRKCSNAPGMFPHDSASGTSGTITRALM